MEVPARIYDRAAILTSQNLQSIFYASSGKSVGDLGSDHHSDVLDQPIHGLGTEAVHWFYLPTPLCFSSPPRAQTRVQWTFRAFVYDPPHDQSDPSGTP